MNHLQAHAANDPQALSTGHAFLAHVYDMADDCWVIDGDWIVGHTDPLWAPVGLFRDGIIAALTDRS